MAAKPRFDLTAIKEALPMLKVCQHDGLIFTRAGTNQTAHCPFHAGGKRKTFTVHGNSPDHAHCYDAGCGWNGDIFKFWQARQECDFPAAVAALAGLAGIGPLPEGVKWKVEKPVKRSVRLEDKGKPDLPEMRAMRKEEKAALAKLRGVSLAAVERACEERVLCITYYPVSKSSGKPGSFSKCCWCVTDGARWTAQYRRLDGVPWGTAEEPQKSISAPNTRWPVGTANLRGRKKVLLVEGGPDMLAAWGIVEHHRQAETVAVICMLGGENSIAPEALEVLQGCEVIIVADHDEPKVRSFKGRPAVTFYPGLEAAGRWFWQLRDAGIEARVANLSSLGLPAKLDLNDLVKRGASDVDLSPLAWALPAMCPTATNARRIEFCATTRPVRYEAVQWASLAALPSVGEPVEVEEQETEIVVEIDDESEGKGHRAALAAQCDAAATVPGGASTAAAESEEMDGEDLDRLLSASEQKEFDALRRKLRDGQILTNAEKKTIRGWLPKREKTKTFNPAAVAERLDLWWVNGDGGNYYLREEELWIRVQRERVVARLLEIGVRAIAVEGEGVSPAEEVLLYVERHRVLSRALEGLAGYKAGVRELAGVRILIQTGPRLIEPVQGDYSFIHQFVQGRLTPPGWLAAPQKIAPDLLWKQVDIFEGWLQRGAENLYFNDDPEGENLQGQLLALAGEAGSGKGRLQNWLITPALGGRSGDPQSYLFGDTDFSSGWLGKEHLCMEDPKTASRMNDRVELARLIKGLIVNDGVRWHKKQVEELFVDPKLRLSMSFNIDPEAMRFFPPLVEGFRDKVIFLRVYKAPFPAPLRNPVERKAFRQKFREQLPAYLYYLLNDYKLDESYYDDEGRFGVMAWCNPEIEAFLLDDSPAAEFLALVDGTTLVTEEAGKYTNISKRESIWYTPGGYTAEKAREVFGVHSAEVLRVLDDAQTAGRRVWVGGFADLTELVVHPTANFRKSSEKLVGHNPVQRMLSTIAQQIAPNRVVPYNNGKLRRWVIVEPEWAVAPPEAAAGEVNI